MHKIESYACLKMLYFTGYIDGHISSSHYSANEKNPFSFSPYNGATCILSIAGNVMSVNRYRDDVLAGCI